MLGKQNRLMAGYPPMLVNGINRTLCDDSGLERIIKRDELRHLRSIGAEPLSSVDMAIVIPQIYHSTYDFCVKNLKNKEEDEDFPILFPLREELVVLRNHPYKKLKKIAKNGKLTVGKGKEVDNEEALNSYWNASKNSIHILVREGPINYNYDKLHVGLYTDNLNLDEYGLNIPEYLKEYGRKWNTALSRDAIPYWFEAFAGYYYSIMSSKTFLHLTRINYTMSINNLVKIKTDRLGDLRYINRLNHAQREFAWLFKDQAKNLAEFLKDIGIREFSANLLNNDDLEIQHSYARLLTLGIYPHEELALLFGIEVPIMYGALSFSDFIKRGGKEFVFRGQKYKISKRRAK